MSVNKIINKTINSFWENATPQQRKAVKRFHAKVKKNRLEEAVALFAEIEKAEEALLDKELSEALGGAFGKATASIAKHATKLKRLVVTGEETQKLYEASLEALRQNLISLLAAIGASDLKFDQEKLQWLVELLAAIVAGDLEDLRNLHNKSVWNLLKLDVSKIAEKFGLDEGTAQELFDRLVLCRDAQVAFTTQETVIGGVKVPSINVNLEGFCLDFNVNEVQEIERQIKEFEDKLSLKKKHLLEAWQIAGRSYESNAIVKLGVSGLIATTSYKSQSMIGKSCSNLWVGLEKEDGTAAQKEWYAKQLANQYGCVVLAGASGSTNIMLPGGVRALAEMSNSLVNAKAYGASVMFSASSKEIDAKAWMGVTGYHFLDDDGNIVYENGKPKFVENGNEGSHFVNRNLGDHNMQVQVRAVTSSYMDRVSDLDCSQAEISAKANDYRLRMQVALTRAYMLTYMNDVSMNLKEGSFVIEKVTKEAFTDLLEKTGRKTAPRLKKTMSQDDLGWCLGSMSKEAFLQNIDALWVHMDPVWKKDPGAKQRLIEKAQILPDNVWKVILDKVKGIKTIKVPENWFPVSHSTLNWTSALQVADLYFQFNRLLDNDTLAQELTTKKEVLAWFEEIGKTSWSYKPFVSLHKFKPSPSNKEVNQIVNGWMMVKVNGKTFAEAYTEIADSIDFGKKPTKDTIFGVEFGSLTNIGKGQAAPVHMKGIRHIDTGEIVPESDIDLLFHGDGICKADAKSDLNAFKDAKVREHFTVCNDDVSKTDLSKLVVARYVMGRPENLKVAFMRYFKKSKVSYAPQALQRLPTALDDVDGYISSTKQSAVEFRNEISRYKHLFDAFLGIMDEFKASDHEGNALSSESLAIDWDSVTVPADLWSAMIGAYLKIKGTTIVPKILESLKNSSDASQVKLLEEMGLNILADASQAQKFKEAFSKKVKKICSGSFMKGDYLVAQHVDFISDNTVIIPAGMCVGLEELIAIIYRYPVASATSVANVNIISSDDERVRHLVEAMGWDPKNMPPVMLVPSSMKKKFQCDDDGDQFGIVLNVKLSDSKWKMAALKDGLAIGNMEPAEQIFKNLMVKLLVAMNYLERGDMPRRNIEMEDVKTSNNKKKIKILDETGKLVDSFVSNADLNQQGPVGLVDAALSVQINTGLSGYEMVGYEAASTYLLQHSIDSAKKEKLVIPVSILMNTALWVEIDGLLELLPIVNEVVLKWNVLYDKEDVDGIKALEANYDWLPRLEDIIDATLVDENLTRIAPSTYLAKLAKYAVDGSYQTATVFGRELPAAPWLVGCKDPTRYSEQHVFQAKDVQGSWKSYAGYTNRNLKIENFFKLEWSSEHKAYYWAECPDARNYPSYWTREDGFQGSIGYSYPNLAFAPASRWMMEIAMGGQSKMATIAGWFRENTVNKASLKDLPTIWNVRSYETKSFPVVSQIDYKANRNLFLALLNGSSKKNTEVTLDVASWLIGEETTITLVEALYEKAEADGNTTAFLEKLFAAFSFWLHNELARQPWKLNSEMTEQRTNVLKSFKDSSEKAKAAYRKLLKAWEPMVSDNQVKDYVPSNSQRAFCGKLSALLGFEYRLAHGEGFRHMTMPERTDSDGWTGSLDQWKVFMKSAFLSIFARGVTVMLEDSFYICAETKNLKKRLAETQELYEEKDGVKSFNKAKLSAFLENEAAMHLVSTGCSLKDCQECNSVIRSAVIKVERNASMVVGSKAYAKRKAQEASARTAKALLDSVECQMKASLKDGTDFGYSAEDVKSYVEAFGTDVQKASFELPTQYDKDIVDEFGSWFRGTDKDMFLDFLESVGCTANWWTLPLDQLTVVCKFLVELTSEKSKDYSKKTFFYPWMACPKCGGEVVTGKTAYGCSDWNVCDFRVKFTGKA